MLQTSQSLSTRSVQRTRRLIRWIVWTIVILGLLFLIVTGSISYYIGSKLIHPVHKPITATPADYGLKYQTITFHSTVDDIRLSGWLIPAATGSNKVVIEAHGYGTNRMSDNHGKDELPMAQALHKAGYAVIMFDFRDSGLSGGKTVTVGLREQRDLTGAVNYAKSKGYQNIGLLGYSMGASTALEVAASDPAVHATVADSPFANLYQYLQGNMPIWTHLPNWPFTPEIFTEIRLFDGINVHKVNPAKDLQHFGQRPLLLIAGTADVTIPMSNSKQLATELKNDANMQLWIVPGAKHVAAYSTDPTQYRQKVTSFFNRYL